MLWFSRSKDIACRAILLLSNAYLPDDSVTSKNFMLLFLPLISVLCSDAYASGICKNTICLTQLEPPLNSEAEKRVQTFFSGHRISLWHKPQISLTEDKKNQREVVVLAKIEVEEQLQYYLAEAFIEHTGRLLQFFVHRAPQLVTSYGTWSWNLGYGL